ncbi:MAG: PHP domain-containing protein, partial [Candidatus Puniceispirillum sp.]|nr:PHP domain-containing protein [Candidatus Puniceispirillum sp.]
MPASFVHLRLHSAYSLAESTLRIKSLCSLIADDQQPAAAITDTNNMFGALEFAQTLVSAGVQPIMGTQINLKDAQGQGEVVLLAKSDLGYMNLSKLLSKTLLEADAVSDPACLLDDLAAHADDLILLSGGAL